MSAKIINFGHKWQKLITISLVLITLLSGGYLYYHYLGYGLFISSKCRKSLNEINLTEQNTPFYKATNVSDYTFTSNNNLRHAFNSITLVNTNNPQLYDVMGKPISANSKSFLTYDKSKINYVNALVGNNYRNMPNLFINANLPGHDNFLSGHVLDQLDMEKALRNRSIIRKDAENEYFYNREVRLLKKSALLNLGENCTFIDKYPNYFWAKRDIDRSTILKNYHYHSTDNHGVSCQVSNVDYDTGKVSSDDLGISDTNKYIPDQETAFHQEVGKKAVTYQEILNYFHKNNNIIPSVNNTVLESYNNKLSKDVAYNIYVHQLLVNKDFNQNEKNYIARHDYSLHPQPLFKPNWYMGSQFLWDSYALEPVKSLSNKCLVGTWFNVYVNGDNVKAIDGKPVLETKTNGQLYNTNLQMLNNKLYSYNKYRLAFVDQTSPIKTDNQGNKYVPIKLGCNYAMALNETLKKACYGKYKLIDVPDADSDVVKDDKYEKHLNKLSQQTCYIPLSSLKQIAGKPVK